MSLETRISTELAPFFKFATNSNPSKVVQSWVDPHQQKSRTHLVYQNCVSCNVQNWDIKELDSWRMLGIRTYFCVGCFENIILIENKYLAADNFEEYKAYHRICMEKLYSIQH